jgi:hypothetical protein
VQASPAQQGWFGPPHVVHMPPPWKPIIRQPRPAPHVLPAQQAWPLAPHGVQVLFTQAVPEAEQKPGIRWPPPQQGWPRPPHMPHEPSGMHAPAVAPQGMPGPTHRRAPPPPPPIIIGGAPQHPPVQLVPLQHSWPGAPQGTQLPTPPPVQVALPLHRRPAQQG